MNSKEEMKRNHCFSGFSIKKPRQRPKLIGCTDNVNWKYLCFPGKNYDKIVSNRTATMDKHRD